MKPARKKAGRQIITKSLLIDRFPRWDLEEEAFSRKQ
jgi:hypothetical protein